MSTLFYLRDLMHSHQEISAVQGSRPQPTYHSSNSWPEGDQAHVGARDVPVDQADDQRGGKPSFSVGSLTRA